MFEYIYKYLKANNINCYSIGQHKGVCQKEYVVIKNNTPRALSRVLLDEEVELLLYFPIGKYSAFNGFIDNIKQLMNKLELLEENLTPFPIIVEDERQAYMTILSYTNTRKRVF